MVSTPISALACDLSCWLHPIHSDCHTLSSVPAEPKTPRSMSSAADMDMGSPDMGSMGMGPEMGCERGEGGAELSHVVNHTRFRHSMFAQVGVAAGRFEDTAKPESSAGVTHSHSTTSSPCDHGACSQNLASSSPPGAGQYRRSSLNPVPAAMPVPVALSSESHLLESRIPPPKNSPDNLTTLLRI